MDDIMREESLREETNAEMVEPVETKIEFDSEERLDAVAVKTGGSGLKVLYAFMWVLAVIAGTLTGVAGSLLSAFTSMANYDTLLEYYQSYAPDSDGDYADYWQLGSQWTVNFASENMQSDAISNMILVVLGLVAVFIACLVVLCVLTGRFTKNEDGGIRLNWLDRIWSEFLIVFGILAACGAVGIAVPIYYIWPHVNWLGSVFTPSDLDDYVFGPKNSVVIILCAAGIAACIALALLCFVSLVKKIKVHKLLGLSLLGKVFAGLGSGVKTVIRAIKTSDKFMLKYVGALVGMVLLAITWIGAVVDLVIIVALVPKEIRKFQEIRSGVSKVKDGDLAYKIPVTRDKHGELDSNFDALAEDINSISGASEIAIQNELKTQRMKTELISNVSHDLKTPLTSMVSYIDLLKKEGLDSENAPEYLRILDEKTERLRTLTEELFDAAKASSGAIPVNMEAIDLESLVSQSIAEMEGKLSARGLEVIVGKHVENAKVMADGQLLWRVLENLLGNVSKYALENSRVYIDISEQSGNGATAATLGTASGSPATGSGILLEVKNISKDKLNISEAELMERFTRGDESRNTEGSGLGLAIAKDLVRLMDGKFNITIDGDLFKASVLLTAARG